MPVAKGFLSIGLLFLLPFLVSAQLSVSINGTSPTCNGWTNGSVEATVSNGTAPYSFMWNGSSPSSSSVLSSIGAGTYDVVVTDANGDTGSATFTLTEPSAIVVDITTSGGSCMGSTDAVATASGGAGGYSYAWDNGSTSATASGLGFGVHCVTVTDASGCQSVGCTTISSGMSIEMVVQGLACFNFCDASVEAVVTGGTPPYTYSWNNGASGSVNANLGPGTYSVTVTDAAGCTISGSATVANPDDINISVVVDNPACATGGTGSATATASGGTAPYTYNWSTGATGPTISGLAPGTYGLTVTDFLGCNEQTSVMVIADSGVTLDVQAVASSGCGAADGSASVAITGGNAPFDISWSNGATGASVSGLAPGSYTVMVTDADGCGASATVSVGGSPAIDLHIMGVNSGCAANGSASAMVMPGSGTPPFQYSWSNGATTSIINNLDAGTYSVVVTDAAGCTATDQITVTGSSDIAVSATATDNACFGENNGSATATATGASGQVFYMWSNGGSSQTINNLATGTYFVTVVDNASGCTATTSAFVGQPSEVTATASGVNGGCTTLGSAEAAASGGTGPYTFAWSTGDTGASISGLSSGTYTVTTTDANGCTDEASVTIASGGGLDVAVDITNPSSSTTDDGSVTATASGGQSPYTYIWNTSDYGPTISGLAGGTYSVTVTDVQGCTGTAVAMLQQLGCIGNKVWNDLNRDGCQDPGEIGVGGVAISLTGTDVNGNAVNMTTQTLANGSYLFEDLEAGDYEVVVNLPANRAFSPGNACTDDFTDSDVNASGSTGTISLMPGHCNVTVDAGIYDNCMNISDPGSICCDQSLCGPGVDPDPINSAAPAIGGGSPVQYLWMYSTFDVPFSNGTWNPVPGATSASYDPGPLQQTTYFIRCARASACEQWFETERVAIVVGMEAFAEITGPDLVCEGDQATYLATANSAGATYHWDFGPWATPSTSNEQNPTITWNQWGVVYITLSVTNGNCTSTSQLGVAITNSPTHCGGNLIVNINNLDNAVAMDWEMERTAGDFTFVVQRSNDGLEYSVLATMPQSQNEGMNEYSFTDYFPKKGNAFYRVELLEQGQHLAYSDAMRVQRFAASEMFMTYPNPVADKLVIEPSNGVHTAVRADVLNVQGQKVQSEKIKEGAMNHSIDMSSMRAGTYFVRLSFNDGETEVIRVVKQ